MQPSPSAANGHRALPVFGFRDLVISAPAQDLFLVNHSAGDILRQSKAYASARSGINKAVHGTGIKSVFPVYEFRMQHYVSLLGRALSHQIGQTLPML